MKITKSKLIQIIKEEVQLENQDREEVMYLLRRNSSADEQERTQKEFNDSLNSAIEAVRDGIEGKDTKKDFENAVKKLGYKKDNFDELFNSTTKAFKGMIPFQAARDHLKKHLEDKLS